AYDSDEGRGYAAAITALMTGEAYAQSARMAGVVGPYDSYALNREGHDRVMEMHRLHAYRIRDEIVPPDLLGAARQSWDDAVAIGKLNGFRNAQASVLAPTGTISFMMDCDTTGVEPDIALVKYKKLVGGGMLKLVTGTVEDVMDAYVEAWKHGVKAIAVYRDGSKKVQPLSTGKETSNAKKSAAVTETVVVARPRRRLADTRASLTHKFTIEGHEGYITVGLFEDNTPGELFVTMAKEGSTLSGMMAAI